LKRLFLPQRGRKLLVDTIAWVMVSFSGNGQTSGLDGIKMLSNLGELPALFLIL